LHEVNGVLFAFLLVTSLPKKLDVVVYIQSPERQREDVIHVVIASERLLAARTFTLLQPKQLVSQVW
jgi:hypothetical protein